MVITLPLFQAFPQRTTNLRHHSLLVYRADSHWITDLTFPLFLSLRSIGGKPTMLRLKPAMLSREEKCVQAVVVAAAVASCPILYNFVPREREGGRGGRGLNVATVRGWTSPPYFFTLAASPPITSKDMPSAVATRVHLTKHIIVDKSTELSQQERSQCYSHVYFTQHEHILTTDTKTLT